MEYQGDALEIGFNVSYLLDVLGVLSGDQIKLSLADPNSSALVEEVEEGSQIEASLAAGKCHSMFFYTLRRCIHLLGRKSRSEQGNAGNKRPYFEARLPQVAF